MMARCSALRCFALLLPITCIRSVLRVEDSIGRHRHAALLERTIDQTPVKEHLLLLEVVQHDRLA